MKKAVHLVHLPWRALYWLATWILLWLAMTLGTGCRSERERHREAVPAVSPRGRAGLDRPDAAPEPPAGSDPRMRKATALEIVEAAASGQIPAWFSPEERQAVNRLR